MKDYPLKLNESFNDLSSTFKTTIASMNWLRASLKEAIAFHEKYPYIVTLDCSVTKNLIKIDKSILTFIQKEGINGSTPLYSHALVNLYRVFTIAIKDVIWGSQDFNRLLQNRELQFLKHIRNASAHNNKFYWGEGTTRANTVKSLPITWRGKKIEENLEGTKAFFDFLAPGDLFILLADISMLVEKKD